MTRLTKDNAVCLRTVDYSDTSQIVTFFTKQTGRISAIAKGSKRPKSPFDGPVEMLSHGQIVFTNTTGDKLATLAEFDQRPGFMHLRRNLFAMNTALLGSELLNGLTHEHDPHPELYDRFLQFLGDINKPATEAGKNRTMTLLIFFQLTLLREAGLQPILNQCANCKNEHPCRWREIYFSPSANGLLCSDCDAAFPDKIRMTQKTAHCLTHLKNLAAADQPTLNNIERLLIGHFTGILRYRPKMAKSLFGF